MPEIQKEIKKKERAIRAALKSEMETLPYIVIKPSSKKRGKDDLRINIDSSWYKTKKIQVNDINATKQLFIDIVNKQKNNLPKDLKFLHVAEPGNFSEGAVSGSFFTYIFTFDGNNRFSIINAGRIKQEVRQKEFTPNKVLSTNILINKYNKITEIENDVNKYITQSISPAIKYVKYLTDLALNYSPTINLAKITSIKLINVVGLRDTINEVSNKDKSTILTDFGEVFVGLVLGQSNYLIGFPYDANETIIDLCAKKIKQNTDFGIGISVKKEDGGRPSIIGIISRIEDLESQQKGIIKDNIITDLFRIIKENSAIIQMPILAIKLSKTSNELKEKWDYFKIFVQKHGDKNKIMAFDWNNIQLKDNKAFSTALLSVCENLEKKYNIDKVRYIMLKFSKDMGARGHAKVDKYNYKHKKRWGFLFFPLKIAVINVLNEDKKLLDDINNFLKLLAIKQFHINVIDNGIRIKIVSFGSTGIKFSSGADSSITPGNSKLAFSLLKKIKKNK